MGMIMRHSLRLPRFLTDRRGVAAAEFAMIAPALIFLVMGVLEMSFRFRASEEATRYVHQVADLISREKELTTETLEEVYNASVHMMKPLETTDNLDFDISSVGFEGPDATPTMLWRRVAGSMVDFDIEDSAGMGIEDESVIRVGVRYTYESVLSNLFGGSVMAIERSAYARPREERLIKLDGQIDYNGAIAYFGAGGS
jgi:Flp pilus assembly protein TadG